MANRILGMGDVLSLIEKPRASRTTRKPRPAAKRLMQNKFDMNDMLEQFATDPQDGRCRRNAEHAARRQQIDASQVWTKKALPRIEAIIYSMTPEERAKSPPSSTPSASAVIAAGSGTRVRRT